jgi:hypothetical protein
MRGWKELLTIGTLAGVGLIAVSPAGSRASLFLQEFERSAKASGRVSLVERVVYSLIRAEREAKSQATPTFARPRRSV